jgi:nitrate reductase NapE component
VQVAVGCGGAEVLKPARGRIVNIRRRNAIAVFEVCAATEFVVFDVVDVVLGGGFGAL